MMGCGHHPDVLHLRQQPKMAVLSGASPLPTLDVGVQVATFSALQRTVRGHHGGVVNWMLNVVWTLVHWAILQ